MPVWASTVLNGTCSWDTPARPSTTLVSASVSETMCSVSSRVFGAISSRLDRSVRRASLLDRDHVVIEGLSTWSHFHLAGHAPFLDARGEDLAAGSVGVATQIDRHQCALIAGLFDCGQRRRLRGCGRVAQLVVDERDRLSRLDGDAADR